MGIVASMKIERVAETYCMVCGEMKVVAVITLPELRCEFPTCDECLSEVTQEARKLTSERKQRLRECGLYGRHSTPSSSVT